MISFKATTMHTEDCGESIDTPRPRAQDISLRGCVRHPNVPLNIQSIHTKRYTPLVSALKVESKNYSLLAQYLHLKFGCQNLEYIRRTAQLGHIKGIPADIGKYHINCPLCKISAATKLPRGGPCDTTELRKGSAFHVDWLIFNTESCRGFKTALLIKESVSRRLWGFPTQSRSAPLEQMRYFVGSL